MTSSIFSGGVHPVFSDGVLENIPLKKLFQSHTTEDITSVTTIILPSIFQKFFIVIFFHSMKSWSFHFLPRTNPGFAGAYRVENQ